MNGTRPATKWRCISARLGSAATNPPPGRSAGTVSGTCASDAQNYPFSRTSTKDPCSRHGFADRGKPRQTPRRRARRSRCVREIQGETIILAGGTPGLAAEWPRPRSGAYARRRRRPEKSGASCCARLNRPPGQRVACRHTGVRGAAQAARMPLCHRERVALSRFFTRRPLDTNRGVRPVSLPLHREYMHN